VSDDLSGALPVRELGRPEDPAVLVVHAWWGLTPSVQEWADDLVRARRRVLLPDLYGGRTAATVADARALADGLDHEVAGRALAQCADRLAAQGRPWAVLGWSLGAHLGCRLAGRGEAGPDELVLFYGGQPPGGPVSRTRRVVLHVAPDDEWFTDEELAAVEHAFRTGGCEVVTHRYGEARHWFAERGSPAFDAAAHGLARSRVVEQLTAGRATS
jgi:carboxymethylenebutenolidase